MIFTALAFHLLFTPPNCQSIRSEQPIIEYVRQEFNKAGLDSFIALKILDCESKYDINAIHKNGNGSTDYFLCQLNSRFYPIPEGCDWKCQTQMAIEIVKRRGFDEWSCWRILQHK